MEPNQQQQQQQNKQAKYNQRHWSKEQTDSNQRGEGRGVMGEYTGRAT